MKRIIILIIFSLAICSHAFAQIQIALDKAREIKLLESSREDVRKMFAGYKSDSVEDSNDSDKFYTNDAEIQISYSKGQCEDEDSEGFNVPAGKVEYIEITPSKLLKVRDSGINFSKYKREKIYNNAVDIYAYYDKEIGILFRVNSNEIEEINLFPPPRYYPLLCNQEKAKKLSSTTSVFTRKLKDRIRKIDTPAAVEKLNLSRREIKASCNLPNAEKGSGCPIIDRIINVFTISSDPESDEMLTFSYSVSGGKIIGSGAKVSWDLSSVKAGTYTITAAVDDGCGFCGITKTKSVIVKECPDCH